MRAKLTSDQTRSIAGAAASRAAVCAAGRLWELFDAPLSAQEQDRLLREFTTTLTRTLGEMEFVAFANDEPIAVEFKEAIYNSSGRDPASVLRSRLL